MTDPSDMTASDQPTPIVAGAADAENVDQILRARAKALAKKTEEPELEKTTELVQMDLGSRACAVDAEIVREVVAVREITPLPSAPDFVQGLINVRGKIFAVLDLRNVFDGGESSGHLGQVMIVEVDGVEVGFSVRECGVVHVPQSGLADVPAGGAPYFKQTTADGVGILDVAKIIGDTRQTAASLASEATS